MGLTVKTAAFAVVATLAASLGGCSTDVMDQVVGGSALLGEPKVGALSTTATYRTVIAKFDADARVCPEPPPDVAVAVTSTLLAQISANKGDVNANATLAESVAEKVGHLLRRTTALQFYRDARSYNCFAHMNGALSPKEYVAANQEATKAASMLLALEILKDVDTSLPDEITATLDSEDLQALQDLIEKLEKQED